MTGTASSGARGAAAPGPARGDAGGDALTEAVLDAARALVAISVRSLAATGDVVTVAQQRVLMLVTRRTGVNVADIAAELGVHRSNATRVVDRMVQAGLVARTPDPRDRRRLLVTPTAAGRQLVSDVDDQRRVGIAEVLARIPEHRLVGAESAWRAFATAADEG